MSLEHQISILELFLKNHVTEDWSIILYSIILYYIVVVVVVLLVIIFIKLEIMHCIYSSLLSDLCRVCLVFPPLVSLYG